MKFICLKSPKQHEKYANSTLKSEISERNVPILRQIRLNNKHPFIHWDFPILPGLIAKTCDFPMYNMEFPITSIKKSDNNYNLFFNLCLLHTFSFTFPSRYFLVTDFCVHQLYSRWRKKKVDRGSLSSRQLNYGF
jgi:hypothetical protein